MVSHPSLKYGGIEQVVYNLVEGLVEAGHQVTLFAPARLENQPRSSRYRKSPTAWIVDEEENDHQRNRLPEGIFPGHEHRCRHYPRPHRLHLSPKQPHSHRADDSRPGHRLCAGSLSGHDSSGDQFIAISRRQRELFDQATLDRFGAGREIAYSRPSSTT